MTERLQELADDLAGTGGLYERITALVPVTEAGQPDEAQHRKVSASPFPGNSKAWSWVTNVRAVTRDAEAELEAELGFAHVDRSDSDANTLASLRRLPVLSETLAYRQPCTRQHHGFGCGDTTGSIPCVVEAVIERAWSRAREILDVDEPWVPVRGAGDLPRACPFCGKLSIRTRKAEGVAKCFNKACDDGSGSPATWNRETLEFLARATVESQSSSLETSL